MEGLHGVLVPGPLYSIERYDDPLADVEIGFDDVVAHVREDLVQASVGVLAAVPGVLRAWQEDREVLLLHAPGVPLPVLAEAIERFWLGALRGGAPAGPPGGTPTWQPAAATLAGPGGVGPTCAAASGRADWPRDPAVGREPGPAAPAASPAVPRTLGAVMKEPVTFPDSAARMWRYLVVGAIVTGGGFYFLITDSSDKWPIILALGLFNLVVGTRIALRRRRG